MNEYLFSSARGVLEEVEQRHGAVLPFVVEAIDLAHLAHERMRELSAPMVPGIPNKRRVRNEINNDCWRFFRSLADSLIEDGHLRLVDEINNGMVMVFPDGLPARIKKCDANGRTSNYPTATVVDRTINAKNQCLFAEASELDLYIADGNMIDIVYESGDAMGEYRQVALKFSYTSVSPFLTLEVPAYDELHAISPTAADIAFGARKRLTA